MTLEVWRWRQLCRSNITAYCWAKNVESTLQLNGGIDLTYAARTELNEIYVG